MIINIYQAATRRKALIGLKSSPRPQELIVELGREDTCMNNKIIR